MARSRSKSSPKKKQRPSSPAPRKAEHYKQRSSHGYHGLDHRKDLNRSTTWRMHKNGQRRSRNSSRENTYYRYHKRRSSSPNTRSSSDKFYSSKPYQAYSPGREDGNRYMSRYSEGGYYPEYQWDYYPQHVRGRSILYDHRGRRSGKRGKSPQRSTEDSSRFERKQREDGLRSQKTRDEKYSRCLRRRSEDVEKRSSFQKRHTEDRDYRRHGHTSTRHTGVERHDNRERSRNPQSKPRHPSSPHQEKRAQRSPKYQGHRHAQKRPSETSSSTRASSDSRHKRRKTSDGDQDSSDGKTQKYSKEEDRKSTPQNDNGKSSCSHAGRQRETEDGKDKSPSKSSKKHSTASAHSDKSVDFRSSNDKQKMERKKEREDRKESNSSSNHVDESKASDMKPSSTSLRKKSLIIKVDEKKTVNISRDRGTEGEGEEEKHQHVAASPVSPTEDPANKPRVASIKTESEMSADLSAVSKKSEDSEPVLEHLGSTENTENKSKEELAQEIITVIHQVKVNYFPSPPITLHERFSKLKDQQAIDGNENKSTPDSGNPRRVNMPLAELPNKHAMVCESEQTLVKVIDPNDLRHDIERRRKERLQNEDEHIFHIDSATERNDQPFPFLTPAGRSQNPQWVKKSNSTKFIQRTYMSNFRGGRHQPHHKSDLVQKSLYIQAKYQRLRFAGSKGFITNKFRQRLLKKKEHTNMATEV